jgi:hypothetical protein
MARKTNASEVEDDLRPEYDFSKMKIVGRGIYAKRYRSGTNLVLLEPDVRKAFPDDEPVNEATSNRENSEKAGFARPQESSKEATCRSTSPINDERTSTD